VVRATGTLKWDGNSAGAVVSTSGDSGATWASVANYTLDYVNLSSPASVKTAITSGAEHLITTSYATNLLSIQVDTGVASTATWNATIAAPATDWVLYCSPYTVYYKETVGVPEVVNYQPTTMIIGTALPNHDSGGLYPGIFTWGANPVGVTVALGSMVSSSQPSAGTAPTDTPRSVLPDVAVSDWFQDPDVSGTLLTNPIRPFVTMVSDNTSLSEIQTWRLYAFVMILAVTVGAALALKEHLLLCGLASGAAIYGAVALTIFPGWAMVFAVGMVIGGIVAERAPWL
jgi:hypothetical protein